MKANEIFRANIDHVLGNSSVRTLVDDFNQRGEGRIDYSYMLNVRKGKQIPGVEKSEQIVQVLRLVPGFDWIELWMFFVPDYFSRYSNDVLQERQFSQQYFEGFVTELLSTGHRFQVLQLSQKQFEQMAEMARYIYQKKHGEPVAVPDVGGQIADA